MPMSSEDKMEQADSYMLLVLAGMEKMIARLIETELAGAIKSIDIVTPLYWVNTEGVEILERTESKLGFPVHPGSAGCGKILLVTSAPPKRIQSLPYCQAILASIFVSGDISSKTAAPSPSECLKTNDREFAKVQSNLDTVRNAFDSIPSSRWEVAVSLWKRWSVDRDISTASGDLVSKLSGATSNSVLDALKYRASCVRDGPTNFVSMDVLPVLGDAAKRIFPQLEVDLCNPHLEFVAIIVREHIVVGLSLQHDRTFRHGKIAAEPVTFNKSDIDRGTHPEAGVPPQVCLRPSTAAAMIKFATEACGGHSGAMSILVDPCAGLGTIPRVAAALKDTCLFAIGGEIDASATVTAYESRTRIGKAMARFESLRWSATSIPIRSGCVDVVVTDLPFGHRCLSSKQISRLYPSIVNQAAKLLRPGGVFLALTALNGPRLLSDALHKGEWEVISGYDHIIPVNIGGMLSDFVIARRGTTNSIGRFPPPPLTKKQRKAAAKRAKLSAES